MKNKNKQKGITLVALVVTIIILLILAGISISALTGSGLFEKAKLAKEKLIEEQEKENLILENYESSITNTRENKIYNSNIYDEWTTWLYLAGINNPEIYNGKDILLDENIINAVMSNQNAVDYMINSKYFIMPAVCNSELAISKMSNISYIKSKIIENQDFCQTIVNSKFKKSFSEYIVYNEKTLLGVACGGRTYTKLNNGSALAGAFYINGPQFMLVSKESNAVLRLL